MMSDKLRAAAQAALDAMKLARGDHGTIMLAYPAIESWLYHRVDQRLDDAIKAVEDALAEPEQEPVAWMRPSEEGYDSSFRDHATVVMCTGNKWEGWVPLYTQPPSRKWVGLTDEDISQWIEEEHDVLRWAEAKLREKNT